MRICRLKLAAVLALSLATPLAAGAETTTDQTSVSQATTDQPTSTGPAVDAQGATPSTDRAAGAAASTLSPICSDRPTKSNGACTVDAGHFQYEADIVNATFMRLDGMTTDTYILFNPTLKYGLTSNMDVEVNIAPSEIVRTHDSGGGGNTLVGVSDLYLRLKYEFVNTTDGNLQATILPYIKAPTARPGIGNGVVEGGAILPINYKLNSVLTLATNPEVDFLKDFVGGGRHVNTQQLISLSLSLPKNFTVFGEIWGDWNFDPAGTVRQYSADAAIAYGVNNYLQLDAGLNFGLNRETPAVQAYAGISQKF